MGIFDQQPANTLAQPLLGQTGASALDRANALGGLVPGAPTVVNTARHGLPAAQAFGDPGDYYYTGNDPNFQGMTKNQADAMNTQQYREDQIRLNNIQNNMTAGMGRQGAFGDEYAYQRFRELADMEFQLGQGELALHKYGLETGRQEVEDRSVLYPAIADQYGSIGDLYASMGDLYGGGMNTFFENLDLGDMFGWLGPVLGGDYGVAGTG